MANFGLPSSVSCTTDSTTGSVGGMRHHITSSKTARAATAAMANSRRWRAEYSRNLWFTKLLWSLLQIVAHIMDSASVLAFVSGFCPAFCPRASLLGLLVKPKEKITLLRSNWEAGPIPEKFCEEPTYVRDPPESSVAGDDFAIRFHGACD